MATWKDETPLGVARVFLFRARIIVSTQVSKPLLWGNVCCSSSQRMSGLALVICHLTPVPLLSSMDWRAAKYSHLCRSRKCRGRGGLSTASASGYSPVPVGKSKTTKASNVEIIKR